MAHNKEKTWFTTVKNLVHKKERKLTCCTWYFYLQRKIQPTFHLVEIRCKTFIMMNGKSCFARWNVMCVSLTNSVYLFCQSLLYGNVVITWLQPFSGQKVHWFLLTAIFFTVAWLKYSIQVCIVYPQPSHHADPVIGICLYNCNFCVLAGIMVILHEQWTGMPNNQNSRTNEQVLLLCFVCLEFKKILKEWNDGKLCVVK